MKLTSVSACGSHIDVHVIWFSTFWNSKMWFVFILLKIPGDFTISYFCFFIILIFIWLLILVDFLWGHTSTKLRDLHVCRSHLDVHVKFFFQKKNRNSKIRLFSYIRKFQASGVPGAKTLYHFLFLLFLFGS